MVDGKFTEMVSGDKPFSEVMPWEGFYDTYLGRNYTKFVHPGTKTIYDEYWSGWVGGSPADDTPVDDDGGVVDPTPTRHIYWPAADWAKTKSKIRNIHRICACSQISCFQQRLHPSIHVPIYLCIYISVGVSSLTVTHSPFMSKRTFRM